MKMKKKNLIMIASFFVWILVILSYIFRRNMSPLWQIWFILLIYIALFLFFISLVYPLIKKTNEWRIQLETGENKILERVIKRGELKFKFYIKVWNHIIRILTLLGLIFLGIDLYYFALPFFVGKFGFFIRFFFLFLAIIFGMIAIILINLGNIFLTGKILTNNYFKFAEPEEKYSKFIDELILPSLEELYFQESDRNNKLEIIVYIKYYFEFVLLKLNLSNKELRNLINPLKEKLRNSEYDLSHFLYKLDNQVKKIKEREYTSQIEYLKSRFGDIKNETVFELSKSLRESRLSLKKLWNIIIKGLEWASKNKIIVLFIFLILLSTTPEHPVKTRIIKWIVSISP